jgi:4-amino-4-deoxy-L-arabinose transferase-like glycosyltransferase
VPERGQVVPRAAARWGPALLVVLLFGVLVSIRLGRPGFFDNEGRYAEVAREMLLRRDLITPTLNFSLFLNKPPLLYWLAAGAFALGAVDEWVRLVGVLVAVVAVLLTCRLGARLFSEGTGLLAGGFLATTLGFVLESRTLRPDGLLMASVVGGLAGWRAAEDAPERRRTWWLAAGYVALALGVLAKGLLPVALVGIPVFVCTLRDHGWSGFRRLRPLLGLMILLLVAGPWHVAVALEHPGFAWDYLVNQHLLFLLDKKLPRDSEGDPLTVFWGMFLGRALPWIVLLPFTLREGLRGLRRGADPIARSSALCWTWLAAVMVPFSLAPSRLEHYSLPALPAVVLLAARGWQRLRAGELGRRAWLWLGTVAAGLLVASAFGAWQGRDVLARVHWVHQAHGLMTLVLPTAFVLGVGGLALALSVHARRPRALLAAIAGMTIPMLAIVLRAQAEVEPFFSWKPLASSVLARLPESVDVVLEAPMEYQLVGGLAFYTKRRITLLEPVDFTPPTYLERLRDGLFISRPEFARRWTDAKPLAFISDPQRRRATPAGLVPGPFHIVDRVGDRWLLTNHPVDGKRSAS